MKLASSWLEAFEQLITYIEHLQDDRKVIFLDELPWLDTARSKFIQALEYFWNGWASARHDIVLVVCGSATSWMIDMLINNHGGLHNRLTYKIMLELFKLCECEAYFLSRNMEYTRYQIAECYMKMNSRISMSHFSAIQRIMKIVEVLSKKMKGISRDEIIRGTKLSSNGGLSNILKNLGN